MKTQRAASAERRPDIEQAARFRKAADDVLLTLTVLRKRDAELAAQRMTPARALADIARRERIARLQKTIAALLALADAHRTGDVPPGLRTLRKQRDVELLVGCRDWPTDDDDESAKLRSRIARLRLTERTYAAARRALVDLALAPSRPMQPTLL